MKTRFVEVTNDNRNWGKFLLGEFTSDEMAYRSKIDELRLVASRGWTPQHILVFDLQTGEGGWFRLGGFAKYDLQKHRIWVCPMFEPFLTYLYEWFKEGKNPFEVPELIDIPDAPFEMSGYRRPGQGDDDVLDAVKTAIASQCSCHEAGCLHDQIREVVRTYKPEAG